MKQHVIRLVFADNQLAMFRQFAPVVNHRARWKWAAKGALGDYPVKPFVIHRHIPLRSGVLPLV